jgi:hypothetical protein
MATAAHAPISHRLRSIPHQAMWRGVFERGLNLAMVALMWIVPLLIALLLTRPALGSVQVKSVDAPHVLDVRLGTVLDMQNQESPERARRIAETVSAICMAASSHPGSLIVLHLRDLTLSFDMLPSTLRPASTESAHVQRTAYEKALARTVREIFKQSRAVEPSLELSVLGLPMEPSLGGAPMAEQTNGRYAALMAEFTAFVGNRTVLSAETLIGEALAVRRSMPTAVRLANGRPIYYRTDHGWHVATGVPVANPFEAADDTASSNGILSTGVISGGAGGSGGSGGGAGGSAGGDDFGGSGGGGGGGGSGSGGSSEGGVTGGGVLQGTSGVNNNNSGGSSGGGSSGGGGGSGDGGGGGGGTQPPPGPGSNGLRFFVTEQLYPQVENLMPQHNAIRLLTAYQGCMDANDDGLFDGMAVMQEYFDDWVPANYDGPLCLDWEGTAAHYLVGNNLELRERTVQQFVIALNAARQLRPSAKVGMYGLPIREYWNRNQAWRDREHSFAPIYNASDCVFPSVYDLYKNGESPFHNAEMDITYVREMVEMALEMSQGKPVYPFVWPRFHTSNPESGFELIPVAELKSHAAAIFDGDYQGDRADGLVWWGGDQWFYSYSQENVPPGSPDYEVHQLMQQVFAEEFLPGETAVEHFTIIHTRTLRQLGEVVNNALSD